MTSDIITEEFFKHGFFPLSISNGEHQLTLSESNLNADNLRVTYTDGNGTDYTTVCKIQNGTIVPLCITASKGITEGYNRYNKEDEVKQTIGVKTKIILRDMCDNLPVMFRVDTGAQQSSLNVDEYKVYGDPDNEMVLFTFRDRRYRAPVRGYQTVTSSDGTTNRPIIRIDIKHDNVIYHDVEINLHSRAGLDVSGLLGTDTLSMFDKLVDPSLEEGIKHVEHYPVDPLKLIKWIISNHKHEQNKQTK